MAQNSPSASRMLLRGLIRRCAHCGQRGAFFVSWFKTQDRCRGCKLLWQRNMQGFVLGALAINIVLTGAALIATLVVGVVTSYPDLAIVQLLVSTIGVTLVVGVVGYPISYTTWLAIDLIMRPVESGELVNSHIE